MSIKDAFDFLRIVSGPVAMLVAAIAAAVLGNWFAAALAVVASAGWASHTVDELERHTADVRECLQMVDEALDLARRNDSRRERYADELAAERQAFPEAAKRFYQLGRADACEHVNELLAKQGSHLRVTSPHDSNQAN